MRPGVTGLEPQASLRVVETPFEGLYAQRGSHWSEVSLKTRVLFIYDFPCLQKKTFYRHNRNEMLAWLSAKFQAMYLRTKNLW